MIKQLWKTSHYTLEIEFDPLKVNVDCFISKIVNSVSGGIYRVCLNVTQHGQCIRAYWKNYSFVKIHQ